MTIAISHPLSTMKLSKGKPKADQGKSSYINARKLDTGHMAAPSHSQALPASRASPLALQDRLSSSSGGARLAGILTSSSNKEDQRGQGDLQCSVHRYLHLLQGTLEYSRCHGKQIQLHKRGSLSFNSSENTRGDFRTPALTCQFKGQRFDHEFVIGPECPLPFPGRDLLV